MSSEQSSEQNSEQSSGQNQLGWPALVRRPSGHQERGVGQQLGRATRNFPTFQKSVSLTGTSQNRVFSRPVNSPALHPFNETLLPWQLKIGQSIKTRIKDKCQGPFKLVLLYFYGCWEQKTLMRIEDLLQDRCWPQGSDSDTPWRWWWPDLVCGPRQFVIQLHSPLSALRTMRLLSFWS